MLEAISINNFALIDNLYLEFESGLNILTGETGAGKSIIIDALGIALGERASADYIRSGANAARVEASFSFPDGHPVADLLSTQGIPSDNNNLILMRELSPTGRSVCRINGHLVTTGQLKEVGRLLVDIHGQHQHQSLLHPGTHLGFLDAFGGAVHLDLVREVNELYQRYVSLKRAVQNHAATARERAQRLDMLAYQLQEIDNAALKDGEWEELQEERRVLAQREKLLSLVQTAYALLYGGEGESGVLDILGRVQSVLAEAEGIDKRLSTAQASVSAALYSLEDVVPELRHYRESFALDPHRLEEVEERLELIRNLSRKYGSSIAEILAYREQAANERERLLTSEMDCQNLQEQLESAEVSFVERAGDLSTARRKLAADLEEKLATELADLGMAKARFEVAFSWEQDSGGLPFQGQRVRPHAEGFDHVEFLLSTNPGEPPRPLAKIASGGELSRVMLAIKAVLAAHDRVPTLVFDEVDSGIGGRAAQAVAKKLARVGRLHQILCITHLPQIAAAGQTHFLIRKEVRGEKTYTLVERLSREQRVQELGRMLAGNNLTPVVLQHAEELLNNITV